MARPSRPVRESMAQIRKNGRWRRPNDFMRMRTTENPSKERNGSDAWRGHRGTPCGDEAGPEPTAAPRLRRDLAPAIGIALSIDQTITDTKRPRPRSWPQTV